MIISKQRYKDNLERERKNFQNSFATKEQDARAFYTCVE